MAPGIDLLGSALISGSTDVFSIHHSWSFHIVVGCIFDKIVPVIEQAEKEWLKAGMVAHCANVKTLVGPISLGLFPKPDLLVTSGFTCETSPKTLDLLHELYGIPVWYLESSLDRQSHEYPEPSRRIANLNARSLRKLAARIRELTDIEISDDMLLEVQAVKSKFDDALSRLRTLIENSDPLPLSPAHENIWMCVNTMTLSISDIEEATRAFDLIYEELQERVASGQGVVERGAPRVMAVLPAGQTDPKLEHLACEVGIAIIAIDMSLRTPFQETSDDPYLKYALGSQQHTLGMPLKGRIPLIIEGCKNLKVDGLLDRYHIGCRSTVADALSIEKAVKQELGIPVLVLEWENFDPRVYDGDDYRTKLNLFKEMMTKYSR
jgi:benzoyl-CoA reductase/2-hydroxyglutaryl-CoA dehydratase subunit BcrC/BadD/HgdB